MLFFDCDINDSMLIHLCVCCAYHICISFKQFCKWYFSMQIERHDFMLINSSAKSKMPDKKSLQALWNDKVQVKKKLFSIAL